MADEKGTPAADQITPEEQEMVTALGIETPPAAPGTEAQPPATPAEEDPAALKQRILELEKSDKGKTGEIVKERERRRRAEEKAERLRQTNAAPPTPPEDPFKDVADDDFLTGKQYKDAVKITEKRILDQVTAAIPQHAEQIKRAAMVEAFRDEHEDYDDLVNQHLTPNITEDQAREILEARNPARKAYQIAKEYAEKAGNPDNPPEKPSGNGKPPPTKLRGAPGVSTGLTAEVLRQKMQNWEKLSEKEREEILKM